MAGWPLKLMMLLSFLLAPASMIFLPEIKDQTLAIVEFVSQLAILAILFPKIRKFKGADLWINQKTNILFFFAVLFVFIADGFHNLLVMGLCPMLVFWPLFILNQFCYTLFACFMSALVCVSLGIPKRRKLKEWLPIATPFIAFSAWCLFYFILIDFYFTDDLLFFKINATVFGLICSGLTGLVLPFSMWTVKRKNLWFFQIVIIALAADYGIRHHDPTYEGTLPWAEAGWCIAFVGFAWHAYIYRKSQLLLDIDQELAPKISVRSLMTVAVGGANVAMLASILFLGVIRVSNGNDVTRVALLLLVFWTISNEISLWLSQDLATVLRSMFRSGDQLLSRVQDGYRMEKVQIKNPIFEIGKILESYNSLVDQANIMIQVSSESAKNKALAEQAAQVAHDIRSPLAALTMMSSMVANMSEKQRLIINYAANRINDIANILVRQRNEDKAIAARESRESVMIIALIDSLVSEKRVQFRERLETQIQAELNQGYGLFCSMDSIELARSISNLVNNAVEAIANEGCVSVGVKSDGRYALIQISDNGSGIPPDVLQNLGKRGVSFDKKQGSGLGVYQAREAIEKAGGFIRIDSQLGEGTTVLIGIPKAPPPSWFLGQLRIDPGVTIATIDDDPTIHQMWTERLTDTLEQTPFDHVRFSSPKHLTHWLPTVKNKPTICLIDHEFLNHAETGLDALKRLAFHGQAVLVTSHYAEPEIQATAKQLGVHILPKNLIAFVPIDGQQT